MTKEKERRSDQPLRETEEAAYHAFREWPVFLVLRQKELQSHQLPTVTPSVPTAEKPKE